jgi:4-hydroxyphenylacetate 3-monooxygenase
VFQLQQAQGNGSLKQMEALADQCMADYDEDGWRHPAYRDPNDVSLVGKSS